MGGGRLAGGTAKGDGEAETAGDEKGVAGGTATTTTDRRVRLPDEPPGNAPPTATRKTTTATMATATKKGQPQLRLPCCCDIDHLTEKTAITSPMARSLATDGGRTRRDTTRTTVIGRKLEMMKSAWISRPLLNPEDLVPWLGEAGIRKTMPAEHLHLTLATVRTAVEWRGVELIDDIVEIGPGEKPVEIFAWTIKALVFDDARITARHAQLLRLLPAMDHPRLRQHLSLYKGGRMPTTPYAGRLVFGPERIAEFNPANTVGIKHVKIADLIPPKGSPTGNAGERDAR